MIVTPTADKDRITSILCDSWVYDRISEDGAPSKDELEPTHDAVYLIDEASSGLMIFHQINAITCETHIQMLDKSKAMEFCESCIEWVWSNTADIKKIVAQIPEIYPDVCRFAEKNGFKKEGVNRLSYLKNGTIYSQNYYGLVRPET